MEKFLNGYALSVGIARYPRVNPLPESVLNDARDVASLLLSSSHCGYADSHVRSLLDEKAGRKGLLNGFEWLAGSCGKDDTALIFISGHGGRIERGPLSGNYLLPFDFDPKRIKQTSISADELTDLLRAIRARRLLVLFDFCFSGGTGEAKGLFSPPLEKVGFERDAYEQLAKGTGRVIMASSRPDEISYVFDDMSNSLFTHYLLEALRGEAYSRADGVIRIFDIFHYLADKVPSKADQHPWFKAADLEDNFAVSLYLGGKAIASRYRPQPPVVKKMDKRVLRDIITDHFSRDELADLCVDLEQDLSNDRIDQRVSLERVSGGGTISKLVIDLMEFMEHRGYLGYLVQAVRRARPGIACNL